MSGARYGFPRTVITMAKRAGLDYRTLSDGEKSVFQALWRTAGEDYDRDIGRLVKERAGLRSRLDRIRDNLKGY